MKAALLLLIGLSLPVLAEAAPPPPTTIVIIGCRVDDLTGQPGRQDPDFAAKGWRDLEWHINDSQQLDCKREVVALEDEVLMNHPGGAAVPLNPNFSDYAQCAAVALGFAPKWDKANPGWSVMAIGCPVPIAVDGKLSGWHLPECPHSINGLPITCRFDPSMI